MRFLLYLLLLFPTLVLAETACPSSFDKFLSMFEMDVKFQHKNTIYPLKHSYVDVTADPEPRVFHKQLSKEDEAGFEEGIYPSPTYQEITPMVKKLLLKSQSKRIIMLYKPDTGYGLIYHFKKYGKCWKLQEFENPST